MRTSPDLVRIPTYDEIAFALAAVWVPTGWLTVVPKTATHCLGQEVTTSLVETSKHRKRDWVPLRYTARQ